MRKIFLCLAAFLCINSIHAADADFTSANEKLSDERTAQTALMLYTDINTSGRFRYPDHECQEQLSTPSKMWEVVTRKVSGRVDGIAGHQKIFKLKPGEKPLDGLVDFFQKGGITECATIISLVRELITSEKVMPVHFDRIKAGNYSLPNSEATIIESCGKGFPVRPGQFGFITNIAAYNELHPGGLATGQNVFCVAIDGAQEPLYMGFGPFFARPRTKAEIVDKLYDDTIVKTKQLVFIWELYKDSREFWEQRRQEQQQIYDIYRMSYQAAAEIIKGRHMHGGHIDLMDGGYMDLDLLPKRSLLERSLLGTAADDQISDPVLHSLEHTTFLRKIMDGKFGPNFLFCNSSGHFQVRKG